MIHTQSLMKNVYKKCKLYVKKKTHMNSRRDGHYDTMIKCFWYVAKHNWNRTVKHTV
jgi:hypothetical protein